ncbi:hypothetical protein QEH59_03000 [Coraliomargarita sp. SDUM461004]|uniref:General secretion pathway protein GspM n=1 Tax=Thalassobacterium sedimentorum TaxID=3041258 RepID=A0ABU1AF02_9BACT|nr:hypothetical protein [Coraliomargarita sp. SDUM461004]MDQ8193376.1 hypothetical protein [Coraliomargarita sp. SDUM461004]
MSALKDKIRLLYKRMSLREKLLSLCFILVFLFIWSNSWLDRTSAWNAQRKLSTVTLATQQEWLDRSDFFSQGLATALERVDPSKTYAAAQLSGRIDNLTRQIGLSGQADIDSVRTREGEIFNDHNLRVRLKNISMSQLIQLNNLIKQETPYINIQNVRIQKNQRTPEQLDVRYEINSFDLKDPNL